METAPDAAEAPVADNVVAGAMFTSVLWVDAPVADSAAAATIEKSLVVNEAVAPTKVAEPVLIILTSLAAADTPTGLTSPDDAIDAEVALAAAPTGDTTAVARMLAADDRDEAPVAVKVPDDTKDSADPAAVKSSTRKSSKIYPVPTLPVALAIPALPAAVRDVSVTDNRSVPLTKTLIVEPLQESLRV